MFWFAGNITSRELLINKKCQKVRLPFNLELISIEEEGMCRKLFITPLSFTDLTFWYVLLICKLYFGCSLKVSSTLLPSFFGVWDDMKTFLAKDVGCTNYIGKSVIQQHDVVQVKKTGKKFHVWNGRIGNHIKSY